MKKIILGLALFSVLLSPVYVDAQTIIDTSNSTLVNSGGGGGASISSCASIKSDGVKGIVNCLLGFFNAAVYILISLSVLYVIYGAFKMISSEDGREEAKKTIYYGVIGLFVMVSIWGLVNILDNTFRLSGQGPLPAPKFEGVK